MPLVIPATYSQCSFIHQQNDTLQKAVCTIGFNSDTLSDLDDIADSWRDNIMPEVNNSFTYVQFRAVIAAGTLYTKNYAEAGGGSGAGTSPQVAYLIRKSTVHPGRRGSGRCYLPGCDEASVDQRGSVTGGKQTGINDAFLAFFSAFGPDPYLLHNDEVAGPYAIIAMTTEPVVATQRRRLKR